MEELRHNLNGGEHDAAWPPRIVGYGVDDLLDDLLKQAGGFDDYLFVTLVMKVRDATSTNVKTSVAVVDSFLETKGIAAPTQQSRLRIALIMAFSTSTLIVFLFVPAIMLCLDLVPPHLHLAQSVVVYLRKVAHYGSFAIFGLNNLGQFLLQGYFNSRRELFHGRTSIVRYTLMSLAIALYSFTDR